jgi:hypothetical protein
LLSDPAAISHRPEPIVIVATPSFWLNLRTSKFHFDGQALKTYRREQR